MDGGKEEAGREEARGGKVAQELRAAGLRGELVSGARPIFGGPWAPWAVSAHFAGPLSRGHRGLSVRDPWSRSLQELR